MRTAFPHVFSFFLCVLLIVGVRETNAQALRAEVYVSGLDMPIEFVQDPSNPNVQYVLEQTGRIRVIRFGTLLPDSFLNLTAVISNGGERGLLGLAFPPDYASSGRFYVNFTNPQGHTVVARFKRSAGNPFAADPGSRFDLRWPSGQRFIVQPFENHNGGHLAFGPDGYLYIGMGDGGSGNDPNHNAQNRLTLLGKMLRIDVSVPDSNPVGYAVPSTNPFVSSGFALPEIWSFGLRNPWKFSFDAPALGGTGAMFIGDVGQRTWEEIDYEPAATGGRNYGWRNREGAHANIDLPPAAYGPLQDPIVEYDHLVGNSVIGGYVYRGAALPAAYRGRYFFADLRGRVWSVAVTPSGSSATATGLIEHTSQLGDGSLGPITSLGVDANGELYVVGYQGTILRVLPRRSDYDGDGASDLAIYQPGTGIWRVLQSSSGFATTAAYQWGAPNDVPVPGDYDGDGFLELAVYRPSNGTWYLYSLTGGTFSAWQWGISTDVPVPRDYDGDGRTDLAVYRPATGEWFIFYLASGTWTRVQWGIPGDRPVPGDYDDDGRMDFAVFRPSNGTWYVFFSSLHTYAALPWGIASDVPVAGDYDGDGRTDLAVWRPSTGVWWVFNLATGGFAPYQWGIQGDTPVPGDFDDDGRTDLAIWRNATREWLVYYLSTNTFSRYAAQQQGTPLPPIR
jgi:glucose/arabinose dehydrogenase